MIGDAATIIGIKLGNVKTRMFCARRRLAEFHRAQGIDAAVAEGAVVEAGINQASGGTQHEHSQAAKLRNHDCDRGGPRDDRAAALAIPFGPALSAVQPDESLVEDIAVRHGVARAGNVNLDRNLNVNRNINRNVVRTEAWVRPGYRWGPGAAIAAGAAIGFVTAATAAAWAGAAPGPNLCWYYTDASRREGFWDACP